MLFNTYKSWSTQFACAVLTVRMTDNVSLTDGNTGLHIIHDNYADYWITLTGIECCRQMSKSKGKGK